MDGFPKSCVKVEGRKLEAVRDKLEGKPVKEEMCLEHWLEEKEREKSKVEKFSRKVEVRRQQLEVKLRMVQSLQLLPQDQRVLIEQQVLELREDHEKKRDEIYQQPEVEFHLRQEMAFELEERHKFGQLEQLHMLLLQWVEHQEEQQLEQHQEQEQQP